MPEDIIEVNEPKRRDEMRHIPHAYVDANANNDWCAVCGRSEGWQAHTVVDGENVTEIAQDTPLADEQQDSLSTGPLEPIDDEPI